MGLVDIIMPWRRVVMAKQWIATGDIPRAKAALKEVNFNRLPRDRRAGATLLLALVYAVECDAEKCLTSVGAGVELAPSVAILQDLIPQIHAHLSAGGHHRAALDVVERALKLAQDDEILRMRRCNTLLMLDRVSEASAGYRLALARNPNCAEALLGMATLATRHEETVEDAIKYCNRALRTNPPTLDLTGIHEQLLHTLSRAWVMSGQGEACLDYFADMPPDVGWVRAYGYALGLDACGRRAEGVQILIDAIRDDESHPYVFQLLREFSGEYLSPMPVWEVIVRLDWLGSDLPSLQGMLPQSLFRTYHIGEGDQDAALKWIGQSLTPRLFEPEMDVISTRRLRDLTEGYTGIVNVMPVRFKDWADG